MEKIKEIALSKISDILSSSNIITPQVDIWKKIYNNAGLSELYEEKQRQLETKIEYYGDWNNERGLFHNEKCYNALYESFKELEYDQEGIMLLLSSIVSKISIYSVFSEDINKKTKSKDLDDYLANINDEDKNQLLNKYPSDIFKELQTNVNMLGLNIVFVDSYLKLLPFTDGISNDTLDKSVLMQWLSDKYTNIFDTYIDAIKAYSAGDGTGCLSHCRNIITGIFSYKKSEQRKWIDGLQKICNKDKNISNVTANNIGNFKYSAHSTNKDERYQYPRYNLIYKLYSFTSALGSHINEGNVNGDNIDCENATLPDAFLALRMTEDVLIWLYQTDAFNN